MDTGIYTTAQSNSAAFLPLNELTSASDTIINKLKNQNPNDFFPSGTDSAVINGWKAERDLIIKYMKSKSIAVAEFSSGATASFALALQKPFSRGFLTLSSTNPFDSPVVDFGTFRNPLDVDIFVEMVKMWRKILKTSAMQSLAPVTISPADSITTDSAIAAFIRDNASSSFSHPVGSAAMMDKSKGGVVGSDLLVYGTKQLSIVDASIIPVAPSSHTTSTMYAIGEKVSNYFSLSSPILDPSCRMTN
jgi:choline dehydrogenase-like flavoprotein